MFLSYRIRSYAGNFRRRKDQSGKVPVLSFTIQKQRSKTRAVGSYLTLKICVWALLANMTAGVRQSVERETLDSAGNGAQWASTCPHWHPPPGRSLTERPFLEHDIHTASCMKDHPGPGQATQLYDTVKTQANLTLALPQEAYGAGKWTMFQKTAPS